MTVRATSSVRSFVPGLLVASTLALTFGLPACQSDDDPAKPPPSVGQGGTGGTGGTNGKGGSGAGAKGGTGGTGGGGDSGAGGDEAGGSGQGGSGDDPCGGTDATLVQINNAAAEGAIKPNQRVKVAGIVATSHKFLASATSCLWAVTATTAGAETQEYGSIQIVAKGAPAKVGDDGKAGPCPTGAEGGAIPDDIKPGDLIDITAFAAEFLLTKNCDGTMNPKPAIGQKQLEFNPEKMPGCLTKTAGDAVPAPHEFTAAEATAFAEGKNADDINSKWSGALITVKGPLTPKRSDKTADYPTDDATAAVSKFGDMLLKETTLTINNNVVYQDVTGAGPKDTAKRVCWPLTTTFDSITGVGLLDFCTFSLSLRTVTGDVKPESSCAAP